MSTHGRFTYINMRDNQLKTYPASAYDENLNLKLSIGLWLVILFLLKPYIVMLMSFSNMNNHTELINIAYASKGALPFAEVSSLPALALFIAWMRRRPNAGKAIRWIWKQGRALLLISTVLNLAFAVAPALSRLQEVQLADLIHGILSVYALTFLLLSERTRDTFLDFPPESPSLK